MLFKCCFRRNNQVELYQQLLQKHWHLAARDYQVAFTELEFAIIRVSAAFERWQSDCLACCHGTPFSGSDNVILHVIRMHDRPKGISEIRRLLNRDDQSNLQYGVRKLLKAGLIEKTKGGTSKKNFERIPGTRIADCFCIADAKWNINFMHSGQRIH